MSPPKSGSDYDYDELEKEYGDNVGSSKPSKKGGKTKQSSAFESGADDPSKRSFLHTSNLGLGEESSQ